MNVAQADPDLQSPLWELTQEKLDTEVLELKNLNGRFAAMSAELLQLTVKYGKLTGGVGCLKWQSVTGGTVL